MPCNQQQMWKSEWHKTTRSILFPVCNDCSEPGQTVCDDNRQEDQEMDNVRQQCI